MPVKVTKHSVIGKDNHTPIISNKKDRKNAIGIIIKKPLDSEMICAGRAFSIDAKYADIMMLKIEPATFPTQKWMRLKSLPK